jgi:hypothetical protein
LDRSAYRVASNCAAVIAAIGIILFSVKGVAGRDLKLANLIVVAGQSNAVGYGLDAAEVPLDLRGPDPRIRIWNGATFVPMAPGTNTGTVRYPQAWGPETGFVRQWRAGHPSGDLFIVKSAKGSTALAEGPGQDWAPASGELFADTSRAVRKAKAALAAAGRTPRVVAILWMQGEEDATDSTRAGAYRTNLIRALSAMRLDWGDPSSRLVVGRITAGFPYATTVRAAQASAATKAGAVLVDTDSYPLQDGIHYAPRGQAQLGIDMYRAYAAGCQAGSASSAQCSSGVRPESIRPGVAAR